MHNHEAGLDLYGESLRVNSCQQTQLQPWRSCTPTVISESLASHLQMRLLLAVLRA
jgi:hypothetical protein